MKYSSHELEILVIMQRWQHFINPGQLAQSTYLLILWRNNTTCSVSKTEPFLLHNIPTRGTNYIRLMGINNCDWNIRGQPSPFSLIQTQSLWLHFSTFIIFFSLVLHIAILVDQCEWALSVHLHLRFITILRLWLPLGSRTGCTPIFTIVIPISSPPYRKESQSHSQLQLQWCNKSQVWMNHNTCSDAFCLEH